MPARIGAMPHLRKTAFVLGALLTALLLFGLRHLWGGA
jgi:hypothetical protein